ncbi:MAG: hypothetical protein ACM3Y8_05865 [Byssovorax cruenta]
MGIDAKDTDVFHLLQKLKESNGTYPKELLAIRRQGYLRQVAEISAAAGLATALKSTAKSAQGTATGLSSSLSTVLESLLVVAIVAEAGVVTYFYRDKLAALYDNLTKSPKVEEISSPPVPVISSPVADTAFIITPSITPVFTLTVTETPLVTPSQLAGLPTEHEAVQSDMGPDTNTTHTSTTQDTNQGGSQAISTPDPHGNNGNHYGQTPIPARTKEPGNNSNNNNNTNTQDSPTKPKNKP